MKDKYELKTTVDQIEAIQQANAKITGVSELWGDAVDELCKDARLAHELVARVQFLERVAEQAVLLNGNQLRTLKFVPTRQTYETIQDSRGMDYKVSDYPDLAAYLRERASDAGQENK